MHHRGVVELCLTATDTDPARRPRGSTPARPAPPSWCRIEGFGPLVSFHFLEGTKNGEPANLTPIDGHGHRVRRRALSSGHRHRPILALARNGVVEQRRPVLAGRVRRDL